MISAGNDIVSFAATNFARTSQPVFYSKMLSEPEISGYALYTDHLSFEVYVWLLWSVKEAAYKYLKRLDAELVFSPTKTIAQHLKAPGLVLPVFGNETLEGTGFKDVAAWSGTVFHKDKILYFKSLVYPEFVHTVVSPTANFNNVHWGIRSISNSGNTFQSAAVREFVLARVRGIFNHPDLQVTKNHHDIPLIVGDSRNLTLLVSFSHHGRYVAYSFCHPTLLDF